MSTNQYSPYHNDPHGLPPTFNNLSEEQRAHLVRSTRKLGAVLGATPTFLEGDATHNSQKTNSPYPSVPPSSSSSRYRSDKLYLQPLNTAAAAYTPSPVGYTIPPTPTTPCVPSESDIRRKHMAKLSRHLGENIPPELIRVSAPDPRPVAALPTYTYTPPHAHGGPSPSNIVTGQDWTGEWNRPNIQDVRRELRNLKHR